MSYFAGVVKLWGIRLIFASKSMPGVAPHPRLYYSFSNTKSIPMREFELIQKYFQPLAGGYKLDNDGVLISNLSSLVISKDILVEGTHFTSSCEPKELARKCLRVNLSDIASMGATPYGYFLGISVPITTTQSWWREFAAGLELDNEIFNVALLGGDTTASDIKFISITILGVPGKKVLTRSGAQEGDLLAISGTLGEGALGLLALKGEIEFSTKRYHLPDPKVALGQKLAGIATSCIDVSDGLLQDAGHICTNSGVGMDIYIDKLPLSLAAARILAQDSKFLEYIVTGGDDYELLFTLPPGSALPAGATIIGEVIAGNKARLIRGDNSLVSYSKLGYEHFHI